MVLEVGEGQAQTLCQEVREQGMYDIQEIRCDALKIERSICLKPKS